ncbi:MAG: threonylcarbamoyl-AMP synthase [Calditrichaeota bacterium]|nr:threonylcarbamoyl-AMP synthase [Calditrichota bacterium]
MIRFKVYPENPHQRSINKAVEALENGQLIIYPTDTVYGIGCSLYKKHALEAIYRLKGKTKFEPISLICESIQQASQYARISNFAFRILKRCFPGPYTVILEATREIPKLMLTRRKEVGIRIPDNRIVMAMVHTLGHPLANTSVNIEEGELLNDPEEIMQRYAHHAEVFLDAGPLPDAEESTIIKIIHDEVEIIREGKGSIERVLM